MECCAEVAYMYYLFGSYNTWGGQDPEDHLFFAYDHVVSNWWGGIQIQGSLPPEPVFANFCAAADP